MKKSIVIVIGIAIIAAIAIWWQLPYGSNKDNNGLDFSLNDYNGNKVILSDFRDKIVLVNSWAVWCPFCGDELIDFAELQEEFKDEIVIIAVDRAESLETAKGFTDSLEVTDKMIFLLDPSDSFYASIGGFGMPETIFLDKKGDVKIHKRGPMTLEEMREKVNTILSEQ